MTVQRQAQFGVALMSASTPAGCMARTRSEGPQSALNVEMCMVQHRSVWVEARAYFSIRGGGSTGVLRSASTQTRRETHNLWNPDHSDPNKKRVLKPKASSPKFIWCEERC